MELTGGGSGRNGSGAAFPVLNVLRCGPAAAAINMSIDEALLDFVAAGGNGAGLSDGGSGGDQTAQDVPIERPAWLRLYYWDKASVSLGRFQRAERHLDLQAAREAGMGLVRRPTGGKALIHHDELTYCLVLPAGSIFSAMSVARCHNALAQALADALQSLGLDAKVGRPGRSYEHRRAVPCFAEHLAESVLVGGRKIAGSAQLRKDGAVLQHGSLLRSLDVNSYRRVFGERAGRICEKATGISECLGRVPSRNALEDSVVSAFAALLSGGSVRDMTEMPEWVEERARLLAAGKYGRIDWVNRR